MVVCEFCWSLWYFDVAKTPPPLQVVDVGTATNVLLIRGTILGEDSGWELHLPSEVRIAQCVCVCVCMLE